MQGWQGVAHTRMATESAVTPAGCHPFSVGPDQCLVHNGSFANHATIRRELRAEGVVSTARTTPRSAPGSSPDNSRTGADLESRARSCARRSTASTPCWSPTGDSFAVVRDAIACKPAVIAETDDWVAMASEYRALAALPGVERARILEPEPEEVYAWRR